MKATNLNLTYNELAKVIKEMTPEQRNSTVIAYLQNVGDNGTFVPIYVIGKSRNEPLDISQGILEPNTPYLIITEFEIPE